MILFSLVFFNEHCLRDWKLEFGAEWNEWKWMKRWVERVVSVFVFVFVFMFMCLCECILCKRVQCTPGSLLFIDGVKSMWCTLKMIAAVAGIHYKWINDFTLDQTGICG